MTIGSDHAAVRTRRAIADHLRGRGVPVEDLGTDGSEAVDYPDVAARVAGRVAAGSADRGILLCGTGIGVSIASNKIRGIRAALCHDVTTARLARQHNDANVLCLGARTTGIELAIEIVGTYLATGFEGGRHENRLRKLHDLERPARALAREVVR